MFLNPYSGLMITPFKEFYSHVIRFWGIANRLRALEPDARLRGWEEAAPAPSPLKGLGWFRLRGFGLF